MERSTRERETATCGLSLRVIVNMSTGESGGGGKQEWGGPMRLIHSCPCNRSIPARYTRAAAASSSTPTAFGLTDSSIMQDAMSSPCKGTRSPRARRHVPDATHMVRSKQQPSMSIGTHTSACAKRARQGAESTFKRAAACAYTHARAGFARPERQH
eukprot:6172052-Pleurochrysis_carterae.AAC.1